MAGILGGATVGMATNITIHSIKVLHCGGTGDVSSLLDGLDWVYRNMKRPAVVSISIGLDVINTVLDEAVGTLAAMEVLVLVAAGNAATDACLSSLGAAGTGLAVGAIDNRAAQAVFSNYGPCVKMWADGVSINSSWNTSPTAYQSLSGTSMATPLVAGIAACALSGDWNLTLAALTSDLLAITKKTVRGDILVPVSVND